MRIYKATATFGKLENETLSFNKGLNVIYAPNESGKSTWCAFIRAMLYGIDSSERARAGFTPDKIKYSPWSGALMEGSIDLRSENVDITITRTTRMKGAPMREFTACHTGTSMPVRGINGDNAGEKLTGVSREVFRRSAFIGQGAIGISGSPELEKRISSIISSGEENISFTDADEMLRSWQRKRRFNRKGMLPELENSISETRAKIDELGTASDEIAVLEEQLNAARQNADELEDKVTIARRLRRKDSLERLSKARDTLQKLDEEHDRSMDTLNSCRDEQREHIFAGRRMEEVDTETEADLKEINRLDALAQGKGVVSPVFMILCFLLAAAAAIVFFIKEIPTLGICTLIFLASGAFLASRYGKARKTIKSCDASIRALLKKYNAQNAGDICTLVEGYRILCEQTESAELRERSLRRKYDEGRDRLAEIESSVLSELDFIGGNTEAARLTRELNAERSNIESLSSRINTLKGRLSASGDLTVLRSSLMSMNENRELLEEEYSAIELAVTTLRQADDELQSRFSPELGRVAAEYMSRMTGGRYSEVLISRDFSAMARTGEDVTARSSDLLSAGTGDLLYLAVRLAVCTLAMPEGEPCPLIIDDALVNLDPERTTMALDLLKDIALERQVILFTCRKFD